LKCGIDEASHVYAFDHAALGLFESAKTRQQCCILDQIYPALYEEKLEMEEEERWPDWPVARRSEFYQSRLFQEWRDIQMKEWQLADIVIAGSHYSKRAICEISAEVSSKVRVVPLTVNLEAYRRQARVRETKRGAPLRVLYAGSINLRKGIPYLLKAFIRIPPDRAGLKLVGNIGLKPDVVTEYSGIVNFAGAIPHSKMAGVYHDADVFVFPTISDGFGAVMLEAMATGLPVIATGHCADIVEHGYNGLRIPIRDSDGILDAVDQIIAQPDLLPHLSTGAIQTAGTYSMPAYVEKLTAALELSVTYA
jgi:glycosyltransferase involved in cell wall biosynthesis